MKRHNLETNFLFLKNLKNTKNLGQTKLKVEDGFIKENDENFYRSVYYKKAADEFQVGKFRNYIKLTEYKNGIPLTTLILKK
jgi:hypothetical protein